MREGLEGAHLPYRYAHQGLRIDSAMELPQLAPSDHADAGDVRIEHGTVAFDADAAHAGFRNWISSGPDHLALELSGIGRFSVHDGARIVAEPASGAARQDVVSIVLGSAMSALLQQRGILPVHASSVAVDGGALLVMGRSGAGKSSLIAQLIEMGHPLLADDVTGVRLDADGLPQALPGFPAIRLWRDALKRLGREDDAGMQVREGIEKYYLPIASHRAGPLPIRGIVRLSQHNADLLEMEPLVGPAHVQLISKHVHRKNYLAGMGLQKFGFDMAVRIARGSRAVSVVRPATGAPPPVIAARVLEWLAGAEA